MWRRAGKVGFRRHFRVDGVLKVLPNVVLVLLGDRRAHEKARRLGEAAGCGRTGGVDEALSTQGILQSQVFVLI
jgi:hypothetical protein